MEKPYVPISCIFFDFIEHYATHKQEIQLRYSSDEQGERTIRAVIHDTQTRKGEEFLILDSGLRIRMDQIIAIEDKVLADYQAC